MSKVVLLILKKTIMPGANKFSQLHPAFYFHWKIIITQTITFTMKMHDFTNIMARDYIAFDKLP